MGTVAYIQPKTMNKRYKNCSYTITYLPESKKWQWKVTYIQTSEYSDISDSPIRAQKAAEKHIDKTLEIRG